MFFDSDYFPTIGYANGVELDDPRRRREEKTPLVSDLPPRGDPWGSLHNGFTPNSDWISFHTTVSTPDDQIALSPAICNATGTRTAATTLPMTWAT